MNQFRPEFSQQSGSTMDIRVQKCGFLCLFSVFQYNYFVNTQYSDSLFCCFWSAIYLENQGSKLAHKIFTAENEIAKIDGMGAF
jgi:hypothetical protein